MSSWREAALNGEITYVADIYRAQVEPSSNVSNLYSERARFEFRLGHRLY
jgi:hypothetical protein